MTEQILQPEAKKQIALEELYSLCQDDTWLMDFIQDTEEHRMVKAPSHMKEETLIRLSPTPSPQPHQTMLFPAARPCKNSAAVPDIPEKKPMSKRMELFLYSLRVSVAAMGAIIVLFLAPPSLKLLRTTFSDSVIEFSNVFYQREVVPND